MQAEKILVEEELPIIPLYQESKEQLIKENFKQVPILPLHRYDFSRVKASN